MKIGFLCFNAASGIAPAALAVALEARGYDSIWLPEHTNIPVSRSTPYSRGGELPEAYRNMMSPMISLATAASVTTELKLATGVLLALQHDLIDIALQAATLDVLSNGRLIIGVGVGWNVEELANHRRFGLEFKHRYAALTERIAAMRTIWREDEAEFAGRWDQLDRTWIYPKPVQTTIPIAVGGSAPRGMRMAAEHADHWMPILGSLRDADGNVDLVGRVTEFRRMLTEVRRDPAEVPITLFAIQPPSGQILEQSQELGVERVVLSLEPDANPTSDETLRFIDEHAGVVSAVA